MSEAEHTVVAGVLQKPTRMADVSALDPEFFAEGSTRDLFVYSVAYRRARGGKNALDLALAESKLSESKTKKARALLPLVREYTTYQAITDAEFRDALAVLVTDRQRDLIREHGAAAIKAVISGDWRAARDSMRSGLLAAEDADLDDDRPVDLRSKEQAEEERRTVESPSEAKAGGFDIGFEKITDAVSFRRGELTIHAGYTADGKSMSAKTFVYNASKNDRARVLYVALEMDRREMLVLFVAQHAATLDPRGVDYRSILDGNPSEKDKKLYLRALDDFAVSGDDDGTKIESRAGPIHVWAPRKRISMRRLLERVRAMNQEHGLDVVCVDYLELVQPSKDLGQYRLNVKDMCEQGKALAREENVWSLFAHQISRAGRDAAEKRSPKHYLLRDLGESSGVERAADHVLWIYSDSDLKDDREAKLGVAKARKGREILTGFHVYANFPRAIIARLDDA